MQNELTWKPWSEIQTHNIKGRPFHSTKGKIDNKGELLVALDTSKCKLDKANIIAVFKIMGSDGKEKGAYIKEWYSLILHSYPELTKLAENKAAVKVGEILGIGKVERVQLEEVLDITTYHIYHDGRIEKHIVKNSTLNKYKYMYHDEKGSIHEVCIVEWHTIKEKQNGVFHSAKPTHSEILSDTNVKEGQTERRVIYENGDVAEYGKNNGKYFWVLYKSKSSEKELIRMPDSLNYEKDSIHIKYSFSGSQRRYTSPDVFAGFIGALAKTGLTIQTTGSCFKYGSSFPSLEHINGQSIDPLYLNDTEEQIFISSMYDFGFHKQITGKDKKEFINASREKKGILHNSHLHSGFNKSKVKIIQLIFLLFSMVSCKNNSPQKEIFDILSNVEAQINFAVKLSDSTQKTIERNDSITGSYYISSKIFFESIKKTCVSDFEGECFWKK